MDGAAQASAVEPPTADMGRSTASASSETATEQREALREEPSQEVVNEVNAPTWRLLMASSWG